jgi:NADPH:quinone reductase-like Zn-dependent oxidoreductase
MPRRTKWFTAPSPFWDCATTLGQKPAEALRPVIEKNISLIGFNLEGSLQHVPRALGELCKYVIDGSVKVEITKYPLADASIVHALFAKRKTTGKLVLIP